MPRCGLPEQMRAKGDAVAVVGVHVRLDLEDEGGHLVFACMHLAGIGDLVARRRCEFAERVDQVANAEVAQRRAKEHRRHVAFQERLAVERPAGFDRQFGSSMNACRSFSGSLSATLCGPLTGVASTPYPSRAPYWPPDDRSRRKSWSGRSAR